MELVATGMLLMEFSLVDDGEGEGRAAGDDDEERFDVEVDTVASEGRSEKDPVRDGLRIIEPAATAAIQRHQDRFFFACLFPCVTFPSAAGDEGDDDAGC